MSVALALLGSCSPAAAPQVEIAAHYVPACAPLPEAAPSRLELSALGDFEPSNASVAILQSNASNQPVLLPEGTQAAELSALDGDSYWGSGALDAYKHIPILLWPERRGCELARFEAGLPSAGAWLAGASERLATLLALGPGAGGAESYRVDLSSGAVERLAPGSAPRQLRQAATLSELGDQLLLAGGVDAGNGRVLDSGEPFDPVTGRFTGDTVALARPRARHAAVSLPGGSSLLIGGESEAGEALRSVEVVSPGSGRVPRAYDLLATARVAPRAVLLGQERVLVGGGYEPGAAGARTPVASVELLHTDLSLATDPPVVLAPAFDRAFAPLGPGSALAVGGCEPSSTPPADCAACDGGCVSRAVFWIDSRGAAYELEPLPSALAVAAPELVPGANGSPWLIAGARLGRFDPWRGRFELVDPGLPELGPGLGAALAVRPGLFAWLATAPAGVALVGLYHSQRGPWARDVAPLLVGSAVGLVPDRPPGENEGGVQLDYAPATGLELAGPEALVSIADAEYADFTLELALADGPPPLLLLIGARGDAAAFGGFECPWPDAPAADVPARLRVRRSTDQVQLERLDPAGGVSAAADPCVRPLPARVGLQLLGTRDGVSRVTRIEVRRALD